MPTLRPAPARSRVRGVIPRPVSAPAGIEILDPRDLTLHDRADWKRLMAADPALSSPYFAPEWTEAVARRREGVRVVVFRGHGRPVGFLPVMGVNRYAVRPAGAPLCDYQAVIAPADARLDLAAAAKALGAQRIDFTAALKHGATREHVRSLSPGRVVRFAAGFDRWAQSRREEGGGVVRRAHKKLEKWRRETGEAAVEAFSADPAAFDQLIAWKRAQMHETGVADVFAHDWVGGLVRDVFERPAREAFGGAMFVLRAGGKPAAVLFCLRYGASLHAWFVAHDPAHAKHSPGEILFVEAIRAAAAAGFTELDLGPGDQRFKLSLANAVREAGAGFAGRPGAASLIKGAEFGLRAAMERAPVGRARDWPGKAMRRIDVMRSLAPETPGAQALLQVL